MERNIKTRVVSGHLGTFNGMEKRKLLYYLGFRATLVRAPWCLL